MITVYGEGRGFRVVWLLEEMGLDYTLRDVDLLAGVENDTEFLAVNPAGFIPALVDGEGDAEGGVTMVESIAIMQYLTARYGPTALAPTIGDEAYPLYLQFLLMGEAGLAAAIYFYNNAQNLPDPADRQNPTARHTLWQFKNRLGLVSRQLAKTPFVAGENFTAADISVTYALELAKRNGGFQFEQQELDYIARMNARPAYQRAMQACHATRRWVESLG